MAEFDPALVRWSWVGNPDAALGMSLALDYAGEERRFSSNALMGVRRKFPLKEHGVMLKVETIGRRYLNPNNPPQGECEARVWAHVQGTDLEHRFAPILCHAWEHHEVEQPYGHPPAPFAVIWTAQAWVEGRDGCNARELDQLRDEASSAGLVPHDDVSIQVRRRPTGELLWLDYGHWCVREYNQPTYR